MVGNATNATNVTDTAVWRHAQLNGIASIVGENEQVRVEIVPSRGGKVISFINKQTGKDWVFRADNAPWEPLTYGMQWNDGDRSGWDEMFPTIVACPCPDAPWQHATWPDHGEVWALPWEAQLQEDGVRLTVHGVMVPYVLHKTYTLSGSSLVGHYEVENRSPFPFSYMWCAHNLLAIAPGMTLHVDPAFHTVQFQYSHEGRLSSQPYGRAEYPIARNGDTEVNLSVIEPNLGQHAEKYWFEQAQSTGLAAIADPVTGERLTYHYSTEEVPYLAVWANYGAYGGDYTVALEPATGYLDDVYMAARMDKVKQVPGYGTSSWRFTIQVD